nr:MAG TPA: hypothetical protein [Caudoviricetes sp.]
MEGSRGRLGDLRPVPRDRRTVRAGESRDRGSGSR